MIRLFDTHCHLYDEQYSKEDLIDKIRCSDLKLLVDIGTNLETSKLVDENTRLYDFCYGAIGFYPGDTADLTDGMMQDLKDLFSANEKLVAIGEIGLDYHDPEHYPPRQHQQKWFREQLRLAAAEDIPVCIHSRDADEDSFNILKEEALGKIPVLLHCFSGSAELAKEYVKRGAVISLGGPVTFKNARHSVEVARTIPIEKLVVETDAPYLAPVPHRGEINYPFYVEFAARKIAEVKNLSYEEVAEQTFQNACAFYRIKNM